MVSDSIYNNPHLLYFIRVIMLLLFTGFYTYQAVTFPGGAIAEYIFFTNWSKTLTFIYYLGTVLAGDLRQGYLDEKADSLLKDSINNMPTVIKSTVSGKAMDSPVENRESLNTKYASIFPLSVSTLSKVLLTLQQICLMAETLVSVVFWGILAPASTDPVWTMENFTVHLLPLLSLLHEWLVSNGRYTRRAEWLAVAYCYIYQSFNVFLCFAYDKVVYPTSFTDPHHWQFYLMILPLTVLVWSAGRGYTIIRNRREEKREGKIEEREDKGIEGESDREGNRDIKERNTEGGEDRDIEGGKDILFTEGGK